MEQLSLSADRYFDPNPHQREIARQLYEQVAALPLLCPHGHVDPRMFADPDYSLGSPADLLIIPDHYVFRMLYSQGISLDRLGISSPEGGQVERDHRKIWQLFADHFYLFRGTPTGMWLRDELSSVFGIDEKLTSASAQRIYDRISDCLTKEECRPRRMFERFKIEVLCTTDAATDTLEHHQKIRDSEWKGRVIPTFRPDAVIHLHTPQWRNNIERLGEVSGVTVSDYGSFIKALEQRRSFFKSMGATATDQSAQTAYSVKLTETEANGIFQRALKGETSAGDAARFAGNMLSEMARMSIEDGLVMQFHCGSFRNHNTFVFNRYGADKGGDIPVAGEFTRDLQPLLEKYGNDPRLTLILFTLDESTYARELAPLAGHYPILHLGPPWWFFDSYFGMRRFRELTTETAGFYNTVGFNDDTRAFPSIPARHDLWRRSDANWLAGLVTRGIVDMEDAIEMIQDSAYRLAKRAYQL